MRGIRVGYPSPRAVRGSGPGFLRLTAPFELPVRQDGKRVEKRAATDLARALRIRARLRAALIDNGRLPKGIYKRGDSYYVRYLSVAKEEQDVTQTTADLTGKVCMITGATSGIGKAAAIALARLGPSLVLVARDRARGERTLEEIVQKTGNRQVELMLADFSSQQEIRQLARNFLAKERPLHILFNNAGVVMLRREETVDGIETTFAVNHLGYFLLTRLLLERIQASAPSRIVSTASDAYGYAGGRLDFEDLQSQKRYSTMNVYGKSKLANILFTQELARGLEGTGVTANCFHPGLVGSNFGRNNGPLASIGMLLIRPFIRSIRKGAETGVHLCASPAVEGVTGGYFFNKGERRLKAYARNDEDARRLWNISERMTGLRPASKNVASGFA